MNENDISYLASQAYEAYGNTTDFENYQAWDDLPAAIKIAWRAVAIKVMESVPQQKQSDSESPNP